MRATRIRSSDRNGDRESFIVVPPRALAQVPGEPRRAATWPFLRGCRGARRSRRSSAPRRDGGPGSCACRASSPRKARWTTSMADRSSPTPRPGAGEVEPGGHRLDGDLANVDPSSRPEGAPAGIDRDLPEPGFEPVRVAKSRDLAPGSEAGLLDRVRRVGVVGDDRVGEAEQAIDARRHEKLECRLVALLGAGNESHIARTGRRCGGRCHLGHRPSNSPHDDRRSGDERRLVDRG